MKASCFIILTLDLLLILPLLLPLAPLLISLLLWHRPNLPRDTSKDAVQLLNAHQMLVEVGVERSHVPRIRVQHHCVKVERTSPTLNDNQVEAMWHGGAGGHANGHFCSNRFAVPSQALFPHLCRLF